MLNKSFAFLIVLFLASGCGNRFSKPHNSGFKSDKELMKPYQQNGKWYSPKKVTVGKEFTGVVSWYGDAFHGKQTANGEIFNMYNLTAAHTTLPMNTILLVRNLENNKTVVVRINDRGPFVKNRILDLSKEAGKKLGIIKKGTAKAEIIVIGYNGVRDEKLLARKTNRLKPKTTPKTTPKTNSDSHRKPLNIKHKILPEKPVTQIVQGVFSKPEIETTALNQDTTEKETLEPEEHIVLVGDINFTKQDEQKPHQIDNLVIQPKNETQDLDENNTLEIVEDTESNETIQMAKSDFEESNETDEIEEKITNLVIKPQVQLPIVEKKKIIKRFYVQVGSFQNKDGAKRMIYQYKDELPKSLKLIVRQEKSYFKVWVSGFHSRDEASEFNSKKDIFDSSFVVIRSERQ